MNHPAVSLFNKYFDFVGQNECPTIYHRWSFISGIATLLGRRVYRTFGHSSIYPMMYVIIVDNPGTRKSSGINSYAKPLIKAAGYENMSASRTSKEMFWEDLAMNRFTVDYTIEPESLDDIQGDLSPRECWIVQDELADFLSGGQDVDGFCTNLAKLWDGEDNYYRVRNKNSKSVDIWQPTINLLGGAVPLKLTKVFGEHAIGSGFFSRVIFVRSPRPKSKISDPSKKDRKIEKELIGRLNDIYLLSGELEITKEAKELLDEIYHNTPRIPDWRFDYYSSRRHTHLQKLLMVVCGMNLDLECKPEDVIVANTILHGVELYMPIALGQFGSSRTSDQSQMIVDYINRAIEPVTNDQLYEELSTQINTIAEFRSIVMKLRKSNKIKEVSHRNKVSYIPVINLGDRWKKDLIDYSVLTREEDPTIGE